ncbi:MAG: PAC2 family protein [Luteolibacter sp.]
MSLEHKLRDPWLLAVWPGMGGVAIGAAYYLMAKLGMRLLVEFPAGEIFDLENVNVKDGLIVTRRLPRSRMFVSLENANAPREIILFIGDAQPPSRGTAFCRKLIDHARELGVEKVFTFAAMATQMRPEHHSQVFGAAIDLETLAVFEQLGVHIFENGKISGLNGVLLGVAAESGMTGGCLLGEIPNVFSQIPFPKASLAVLEFFTRMTGIEIDFTELRTHAKTVDATLEIFLKRMEQSAEEAEAEESHQMQMERASPRAAHSDKKHLEELFEAARKDHSLAYGLKQELDRLGLFNEYEDRFLDLFKEPE